MVPGGDGLCRSPDGRIGFVTGAFPGEAIAVAQVEEHAGYLRALEWTLVTDGPHRVAAPCPFAAECGGCDWMTLARDQQLAHKRAIVVEALRRTAQLDAFEVDPVVTAGGDLRYRRRVRLHVQDGRAGFYRPGGRSLVVIPECAVAHPELQRVFVALHTAAEGELAGVETVDARHATDGSVVAHVVLRAGVALGLGQDAALARLGEAHGVTFVVEGEAAPEQTYELPGARLSAAPGVFTQVNWEVNTALVHAVLEGARKRAVKTFCDLYAGAGNFTLPLLAAGLEGVAVEQSAEAIGCARASAARAGLGGTFLTGDAAQTAETLRVQGRVFDLALLDPPRSGARPLLTSIVGMRPPHVAYVSCDPVTFARDARALLIAGYLLESVTPFDMFPHTHHVELLAWFADPEPRRPRPAPELR